MSSQQNGPRIPACNHDRAGQSAPAPQSVLFVTTPGGSPTPDLIAGMFEAHGITLIHRSCAPSHVNDLIVSLRNQLGFVVLAGGDALLGAAAIALRDHSLPLGILPHGTHNEVARHLGIPLDPIAAAATILAGHKRRLNLGSVNGRPFFNIASVGLTVQDARHLAHAARRPMGRLRFVWKALRLSLKTSRFAATIRCGTAIHRVRTLQIMVANGHHYQAGPTPGTPHPGQDDFLGLYSLEPKSRWQGRWHLFFLKRAFAPRDGDKVPEARITRSTIVEVVTRIPRPISADGEIVAMTPARFSILPHAIDVFVPAPPPTLRILT